MEEIHLPTVDQNKAAAVKEWLKVMLRTSASYQFMQGLANTGFRIHPSLNKQELKSLKDLFWQLRANAFEQMFVDHLLQYFDGSMRSEIQGVHGSVHQYEEGFVANQRASC